jgi:hypothetical protein
MVGGGKLRLGRLAGGGDESAGDGLGLGGGGGLGFGDGGGLGDGVGLGGMPDAVAERGGALLVLPVALVWLVVRRQA